MSDTHKIVDAWLREGRPTRGIAEIHAHLDGCVACRNALAEVDEVRAWFPDTEHQIAPERLDAMRFQLESAARNADPSPAPTKTRRNTYLAIAAAAAVLVLIPSVHFLGLLRDEPSPQQVAIPSEPGNIDSFAKVEPLGEARIQRLDAPPREVYRLVDGSAWFTVRKLQGDQTFRVVVGGDLVVVRGTRFRVDATAGRLDGVFLEHGAVTLHLATGESVNLLPGDSWTRPAEPEDTPDEGGGSRGLVTADSATASLQTAPVRPTHSVPADTSSSGPSPEDEGAAQRYRVDDEFHTAWQLLRSKRHDAAAYAFDQLLTKETDPARRADFLYWSARSHLSAGQRDLGRSRLEELLREHPTAWHVPRARRLLEALDGSKDPLESLMEAATSSEEGPRDTP